MDFARYSALVFSRFLSASAFRSLTEPAARGRGRLTLVAGGVSHRTQSQQNFDNLDIVVIDIAGAAPALSPIGIGATVSLLLLAGGFMINRMRRVKTD